MEMMTTFWAALSLSLSHYVEPISTSWLVLALAMVFSVMLTPLSMLVAHKFGIVDSPNHRSVHTIATPRLGGIGICVAMFIAVSLFLPLDMFSLGYLSGLALIFMTGLIDDIKPMSHRVKFIGEMLAAGTFVAVSGVELTGVGDLFGLGDISFGPLAFLMTIFCMVGLINAMNLSDGLDGLAGGLAIIAALFFALLAFKTGQPSALVIAAALAGSLAGFLAYNSFPARLFMGDAGSLTIGYTCAVLAISIMHSNTGFHALPVTAALILAVPLLDTLVVMGRRMMVGKSPFAPDKTHLHHHLMNIGLSQNQAVSILYLLMFLYGALALLFLKLQLAEVWQFAAALMLTALLYKLLSLLRDNPWRVVVAAWGVSNALEKIEGHQYQRLLRIWRMFRKIIPNVLMLSFLLPLMFLDTWQLCVLPLMGGLQLFLFRKSNARIIAILHGLYYLIILTILFVYSLELQSESWRLYWQLISSAALLWIILSLFIGHMRALLSMHSLEILLILMSWFVTMVLLPVLNEFAELAVHLNFACIHAIPLLLITKLSMVGVGVIADEERPTLAV